MSELYERPSASKIGGETGKQALEEYVNHYASVAEKDRSFLNQKLPRKVFEAVLAKVGNLLMAEAKRMSDNDSVIREFLERNKLPECLGAALTPEIRTFALMLNALGQWTTAEKLAMDRFLFSGDVRKELRSLSDTCPVCPEEFDPKTAELHHPVRDGRPPILLSKKGHELIEGLVNISPDDLVAHALVDHRKASRRRYSWRSLRVGCLVEQGHSLQILSQSQIKTGRGIFRIVNRKTNISAEQILEALDRYGLGVLECE